MSISDIVEDYLNEEGWKCRIVRDNIREAILSRENCNPQMVWYPDDDDQSLLITATLLSKIPESKRTDVAVFLNLANYGLKTGNFEMDADDGEVRYRVFIDVEDIVLPKKIVERSTLVAAIMLDRYYPGIMAVCYGNKSPRDAVEEIVTKYRRNDTESSDAIEDSSDEVEVPV